MTKTTILPDVHQMKNILIINGHPHAESFNAGLAAAYKTGALRSGADVKEIVIRELVFNPNLQFGYQKRTEREPDLLDAWEKIKWAITTLDQPGWYYRLAFGRPSVNQLK
jgi:putative NADPH-quinone reductase